MARTGELSSQMKARTLGSAPRERSHRIVSARDRRLRKQPDALVQDARTSGARSPKARPGRLATLRGRQEPFPLRFFARDLARPSNRFGFFPRLSLRRLLVGLTLLHLAKQAFALHFFLQDADSLLDVVVADENLQWNFQSDGYAESPIFGYDRLSGSGLEM